MKNKLVLIVALFIAYFIAQPAQAQLYQKGDIAVNAGISFGVLGFGGYGFYNNYTGFFPLTANVEYSIDDKFAVGGYGAFYSRSYKYGSYRDRATGISFGARGSFHATPIINEIFDANIDEEKLDFYASVIVGLQVINWSYADDPLGINRDYYDNRIRPVFGPTLGVRYMVKPNLGFYFEGGRGAFGAATLGVTFKF